MATDPSSLLETLRSKAMLLLRREREVFELRQERARIEVWLNVFQRLSLDFQSRSSEDLQARWCAAIVGELCIQSAGIYRIDRAGRCARLLRGSAQAPLSPELPGSEEIFGFLAQNRSGSFAAGAPSALAPLAQAANLGKLYWLCVSVRGECLLLLAGFSTDTSRFFSPNENDLGHFVLFGNHLGALLDNIALIAELDRERSDLSASNGELDARLRELREAQTKLVESSQLLAQASRRAGMADIATGVLHNVGNVLNSVNVSAEVAGGRLRAMKIAGVTRAAELLQRNAATLGDFLTHDERGRKLPAYLLELGAHLTSETGAIAGELRVLGEHIDHIKSIIAKQQAYAWTAGVTEPCALSSLVEDALGLAERSLAQDGITIERDYAEAPKVLLDRHKVLQILVNLLSNARHAIADSGTEPKRIRVSTRLHPGERLSLSIEDSGVGIRPEDMGRLFTHGFTTKAHGHGFGLHTSAIAAREMGGSLTCESAGALRGATFTLELPVRDPET